MYRESLKIETMIIANPLYDVVFKYLLEDTEIARELLSTILGEEVLALELKPQEIVTESAAASEGKISILRFDFKAVIRTKAGEHRNVLIELQKAKQAFDIMRFRRYLGENYRREDDVSDGHGGTEKRALAIVTIYFLGFMLDNIPNAVFRVFRDIRDVFTGEVIEGKEDFVQLLTHESFMIQVSRLKPQTRTKLERVLQIFCPDFRTKDRHQLDFTGDSGDPFVLKLVERLGRAIATEGMREKMNVEDEIDRVIEREIRKAEALKDLVIAEKDQIIVAKDQLLEEKDELLGQKDQALEEKDQLLGQKDQALGEKDQLLGQKDQALGEKDQLLGQKDQALGEKDQLLNEKDQLLETQRQKNEELLREIEALKKGKKK